MVAPLIAAAGLAALRAAPMAGRAAASMGAKQTGQAAATGAARQFGTHALLQSAQRPQHQDHGATAYARQNPGEVAVAGMIGPSLSDAAATSFDSIISPYQFGPRG
jgi:hypothetical protein